MTIAIIILGILGWLALSLVVGIVTGDILKTRAAQLDEIAVREARIGIGWPKL